ncbi:hypothetical protein [Paenibacillus borealis]|uniref:hypothetical protein n=1 Tax=Paenibacillus borealis TaxID=160799 RepID=UPI0012FDAD00|nr:hypothetical protein [Paenibacillus borealis]
MANLVGKTKLTTTENRKVRIFAELNAENPLTHLWIGEAGKLSAENPTSISRMQVFT